MRLSRGCIGALLALCAASGAEAQGCGGSPLCAQALDAARLASIRAGLVAAGGNPLTGTPSTLGLRVGAPRVGLAVRFGATSAELASLDAGDARDATMLYYGVDAVLGLFDGFAPAPTVGGVASLDLLVSAGRIGLPGGAGFTGGSTTWAAGLRAGVFRESFTMPGITLSAAWRRLGDIEQGPADLSETDASALADGVSLWSLRAVAGKRIAGFGLTAGIGHDRASMDVHVRYRDGTAIETRDVDDRHAGRTSVFANVGWTSLVYTLAAEAGRQLGDDGAFFGAVALRVTF